MPGLRLAASCRPPGDWSPVAASAGPSGPGRGNHPGRGAAAVRGRLAGNTGRRKARMLLSEASP